MVARVPEPVEAEIDYPESDGKPMAETPEHRDVLTESVETLKDRFANHPKVYVSGNMMMYHVRGDTRRHFSTDVFVAFGIPKLPERRVYLLWKEKSPDVAIELTSKSTKKKDTKDKFELYHELRIREYFLFDPLEEYLKPSLQGFRLMEEDYVRIEPVDGRLPSEVLQLHLERQGWQLRFWDPATRQWLPTREDLKREVERLRGELGRGT